MGLVAWSYQVLEEAYISLVFTGGFYNLQSVSPRKVDYNKKGKFLRGSSFLYASLSPLLTPST